MPTLVDPPRQPYFSQHLSRLQFQPLKVGRPKGKQSRPGVKIRQAIEQVFGAMGSWEGMLAWAKDNPDTFYSQVVPKLLPAELAESGHGSGITVIVQRQVVSKDHEVCSEDTKTISVSSAVLSDGGEHPDTGVREMGPDVGTLMHEHSAVHTRMHENKGVGYFGRARGEQGSPTGR